MVMRNEKHGGETAVSAISAGRELTGPAAEIERGVRSELAELGRVALVRRQAIRLETVATLFYGLVIEAAARGDLASLDTYVKRYGWLASSSLRAWGQLRDEEASQPGMTLEELLSRPVRDDGQDVIE